MNITSGKLKRPCKLVAYGPEGIGKSTLASKFPDPLFIDTEGGSLDLDVRRFDRPKNWDELGAQIRYVIDHPDVCKTLVIDTADWAESLCTLKVCKEKNVDGIESIGYGKGYVYVAERYQHMLTLLDSVTQVGINVIVLAHAQLRKFEQPDEMGAYDRYEMKLSKKVAPLVKEWSDALLFLNYKTHVINVDGKGASKGKNKAQGGKRVIYCTHSPAWDAKNRCGMPDEIDMDYNEVAKYLKPSSEAKVPPAENKADDMPFDLTQLPDELVDPDFDPLPPIPDNLFVIMCEANLEEIDVIKAVHAKGLYQDARFINDLPEEFINDNIIGKWAGFSKFAKKLKGEK